MLRAAGYGYRHARKKGLLTKEDLQKRLRFCRKVKRVLSDTFWRVGIGFYLDGVGFVHKRNPHDEAKSTRTMAWRLPCQIVLPKEVMWALVGKCVTLSWQLPMERGSIERAVFWKYQCRYVRTVHFG